MSVARSTTEREIRVLIVDDHKLFADAMEMALEKAELSVTVATTAAEGLEAAARDRPDVVLLDIGLPDGNGLSLGRSILSVLPEAKIVVVTSFDDRQVLQEAMRAGFHGFLTKDTKLPQLVHAVHDVAEGQMVVPQRLASRRQNGDSDGAAFLASHLTRKERQVLELLVKGASSTDIATALLISTNTVRTHIQSILAKLQVHSRLEAVAFATRHNLLANPLMSSPYDSVP